MRLDGDVNDDSETRPENKQKKKNGRNHQLNIQKVAKIQSISTFHSTFFCSDNYSFSHVIS